MSEVKVIYGSTTGNTEGVAETLAAAFGGEAVSVGNAVAADFEADILILGASTWGFGDLQDDWDSQIDLLKDSDLTGKKIAIFGFGDGSSFADTFVDSIGILYDVAIEQGAKVVGFCETDSYDYSESLAERDGQFVGLPLDDENQSELNDERIAAWVSKITSELGA